LLAITKDLIKKHQISSNSFILFVDDGSIDHTWDIITNFSKTNNYIHGIKLSRNFGHQSAILSGLMLCKDKADCVLTIDADLQQDEKAIYKFIDKYRQGYEIISGVRTNRNTDSFFKKASALGFYILMQAMGAKITKNSADYRLVSSKVLNELSNFREVNLVLRGIFPIMGFKTTTVNHIVKERYAGKSKYSLRKMSTVALDGITSFSIIPIRIITLVGCIVFIASCIMGSYAIITSILGKTLPGWASTVIPIYFLGGIQILGIGFIGEYIGKTYMETKKRPRYIIDKTI
jgi:glycosyltransferase involved in cell wall biosynthesis